MNKKKVTEFRFEVDTVEVIKNEYMSKVVESSEFEF